MNEKNNTNADSIPFKTTDFINVLIRNVEALLKTVNEKKRKSIEKDFNFLLEKVKKANEKNENSNYEIDPFLILCLYNKLKTNVPHTKTNLAMLDSIQQIKSIFDNEKTQDDMNSDPILEYVKKSKYDNIINIKREVDILKVKLAEIENRKDFMVLQISNRLAKISTDLDHYITINLNYNDPVEIDKTDKRMIRSVIDATHITNSLNVDKYYKNRNRNNQ